MVRGHIDLLLIKCILKLTPGSLFRIDFSHMAQYLRGELGLLLVITFSILPWLNLPFVRLKQPFAVRKLPPKTMFPSSAPMLVTLLVLYYSLLSTKQRTCGEQ